MKHLNEHLRQALEEADANSKPITIKGPMGNAFTEALLQEYDKTKDDKEDGENKPALESQQVDTSAMNRVAALLTQPDVPQDQDALQVYGVSKTDITDDDVSTVAGDVAAMKPEERDNYVVVVQESPEGTLTDEVKDLNEAMESIAKVFKIKLYPSLEAFAKARFG